MIIEKLRIVGFRGFVRKEEFEFPPETPVIILLGENGKGKSSVLNAIEWCLFGSDCIGKDTGIRERMGWEIKNRKSDECLVELEVKDGDDKYTIRRTFVSARKDEFSITLPNKEEMKDEKAKNKLHSLLKGFTFKDFLTTVFQHQESIRAILTQEPKDRNEAMDRLFGLSEYRNIIDGINLSEIKPDSLQNEISNLHDVIVGKINVWNEVIRNKEDELKSKGIADINNDAKIEIAKKIKSSLTDFSKKIGIELPQDFNSIPDTDAEKIIQASKKEIERLRSKMPELEEQQRLFFRREKLAEVKEKYTKVRKNLNEIKGSLQEFINKNGDKTTLEIRKVETEKKIKEIEQEKENMSLKGATIEKAIKYLEQEGINKNICPICGSEKTDLLDHLKEEWKKNYEQKLEELNNQFNEKRDEVEKFKDLISAHENFLKDKDKAEKKLKEIVEEIKKLLNREITAQDDPDTLLQKEIENIQKHLKNLENTIKHKQEELNKVNENISIFKELNETLALIKQREKAREIENTSEWKQLQEYSNDLKKLAERIRDIVNKIKEASNEEAKNKVESTQTQIGKFFKNITNHPAIEELKIKVSEDTRTGGNAYEFNDQNGKNITPILSQGNYNALALSVFLAMSELHQFEFLIFDDPSQSLGSTEKEKFSETLNDIAAKKVIFLSTMDNELFKLVEKGVVKQKTIYKFSDWKPEEGPLIERK